jgi:hypothetical protein
VLGPEFGDDAVKRALIVRALYGLKSAGQVSEIIWLNEQSIWDGTHAALTGTFG